MNTLQQTLNKKKRYKIPSRLVLLVLFLVQLAGSGCNIFEEGDGSFNLSVIGLPLTAGSVLTTGTTEVELLAVPNDNWSFSHWSGDVESTENPLLITLTKNTQINANFVLSGSNSKIKLRVNEGQFGTDLEFGQVEGATDGFDSLIDIEAPPPPPDGIMYAWFEGSDRPLLYDYRNPFTVSPVWNLMIDPGTTNSAIEISWSIELDDESGMWILESEDETLQLDMRDQDSVQINLSNRSAFKITRN